MRLPFFKQDPAVAHVYACAKKHGIAKRAIRRCFMGTPLRDQGPLTPLANLVMRVDIAEYPLELIKTFLQDVLQFSAHGTVFFSAVDTRFKFQKDGKGFLTDVEQVSRHLLITQHIFYDSEKHSGLDQVWPQVAKQENGLFDVRLAHLRLHIDAQHRNIIPFGKVTGDFDFKANLNSVAGLPTNVTGNVFIQAEEDADIGYFVQNWQLHTPNTCFLESVEAFSAPFKLLPASFHISRVKSNTFLPLSIDIIREFLHYRIRLSYTVPPEMADAAEYEHLIKNVINHHAEGGSLHDVNECLLEPLFAAKPVLADWQWLRRYNSAKEPGYYCFDGLLLDLDDITDIPVGVLPNHAEAIDIYNCQKLIWAHNLPPTITKLDLTNCYALKFDRLTSSIQTLSLDVQYEQQWWDVVLTPAQANCAQILASMQVHLQLRDIDTVFAFVNSGTTLSIRYTNMVDHEDVHGIHPTTQLLLDYQASGDLLQLIGEAEAYFQCSWPQKAVACQPLPDALDIGGLA